ncbi:MAG: bifunctional hydroxymethylpyrimidine kinase/phosphomethylpyrimidine kinase [Candidatus Eremiobacteraeota bacterium]|nr:bifunctional hydroxymethylpyrimidine kinase/phosphomethylpyrimidine kinase [Candidatus Eremiobacteraeota bacterium]
MPETLAPPSAREMFERMRRRRVLVVGDVMLDEWVWGTVTRISPEAPVPVVAVSDHSFTLGGGANVVNNLCAIGARVGIAGAVGSDWGGTRVCSLLDELQVDREALIQVDDRPTTRKTRIVAHAQQVVRADWESSEPLSDADRHELARRIDRVAAQYDAVILSDYAKGLFSRSLVAAAKQCRVTTADPKPANLSLFSGVTCVAPNVHETEIATGIRITDNAALTRAGETLLSRLGCRYVVITRGERGMALFGSQGERSLIPSVARTVFDVSGAGDTAIAVLTLALAAQAPIELALHLSNYAAGVVVEKLGTATASADEVLALVESANGA